MPSHKLNTELKKRGVKGASTGHWYVEEQIHFNVALKCFSSVPCMECSLYYLIIVTAEPKHITWQNCNLQCLVHAFYYFSVLFEKLKFVKHPKNYHLALLGKQFAISFGHIPVIILFLLLLSMYVFVKSFDKVMFERACKREKSKINQAAGFC